MEALLYATAVAAVAAMLWFANRKGRPVQRWRLIVRPAAFAAATLVVAATSPLPDRTGLALVVAAAVAGAAAGLVLVRRQKFETVPERGVVLGHMSNLALVLFVALFVGRFAFRAATNNGQIWHRLAHHSAAVSAWIVAGFVFLLALSLVQSWGIWRRSRPFRMALARPS